MSVKVKGKQYDTMKEACERLGISRPTMLRYLEDKFFSSPKIHRQGRNKDVRYFDDQWYDVNESRLNEARQDDPGAYDPASDSGGLKT